MWQPLASEESQNIWRGEEFLESPFESDEVVHMPAEVRTVRRRMVDIVDPRMSTVGQNIILSRDHIGQVTHIAIEAIDEE